jgi:hypothetical protein
MKTPGSYSINPNDHPSSVPHIDEEEETNSQHNINNKYQDFDNLGIIKFITNLGLFQEVLSSKILKNQVLIVVCFYFIM